jgi:hypothetical protein
MDIFFCILQKLIKVDKVYYPNDTMNSYNMFNSNNYNEIYLKESVYINFIINDIYNYCKSYIYSHKLFAKAKLYAINKFLNNIFISKELKKKVFEIYLNAQNIYFNLTKFMTFYKLKKYPLIVSNDLMLNPLNSNNRNIHIIIQNKSKYLFTINDLINIIESALGNAPIFFPEPLKPKNPYNNFVFTDCELYNIYFKMKYSPRNISTLFHLYFLDNFNDEIFAINNELFLRENSIKRYIFKSPSHILYPSILNMLANNNYTRRLNIDKEFPIDLLVDIFRPFLYYYYIINYYTKFCEKYNYYNYALNYKLKKFYEYNPAFGRQIIQMKKNNNNKAIKKEYIFNTKYINFYKILLDDDNILQNDEEL